MTISKGGNGMGNIISLHGNVSESDDSLKVSNGLTDVLIDYLLLSGSELADTESKKRLVAFLADKQQTVIGLGNVGFMITEMPWQAETFNEDKEFMLHVTDHAAELSKDEAIWNMIGYKPDRMLLDYALNGFRNLIDHMTEEHIDRDILAEWLQDQEATGSSEYEKCPKHGLIMSQLGCKFCNDSSQTLVKL